MNFTCLRKCISTYWFKSSANRSNRKYTASIISVRSPERTHKNWMLSGSFGNILIRFNVNGKQYSRPYEDIWLSKKKRRNVIDESKCLPNNLTTCIQNGAKVRQLANENWKINKMLNHEQCARDFMRLKCQFKLNSFVCWANDLNDG